MQQVIRVSLLLVVLALAGCGKPVQQGQIFVATQGGQNVKLGAVEILAFDETTINAFISQRQTEIAKQRAKLKEEVDAAQSAAKNIEEPYNKAMSENGEAKSRYYAQDTIFRTETRRAEELGKQFGELSLRIRDLSNYVAEADQRVAAVVKQAEDEAARTQDESYRNIIFRGTNQPIRTILADKQNQQGNLDSLLPKYNKLKQQVTEQAATLETEKQKLQSLESELQVKQKAAKDAEDEQSTASRRLEDAKQALVGFDVRGILFKDMPQPTVRTVSDADGRYRLELPSSGRFVVYAHAHRTVVETEDYFWFVWTSKGDLLLNNANVFGVKSADQLVPGEL